MCRLPVSELKVNGDYAEKFLPDLLAATKECNDHNQTINRVNGTE